MESTEEEVDRNVSRAKKIWYGGNVEQPPIGKLGRGSVRVRVEQKGILATQSNACRLIIEELHQSPLNHYTLLCGSNEVHVLHLTFRLNRTRYLNTQLARLATRL